VPSASRHVPGGEEVEEAAAAAAAAARTPLHKGRMAGQDRGGNEGFSGLPLWKVQQQMAQYRSAMPINQPDFGLGREEPPEPPNVLADGLSMGGPGDSKQKPLVRHVLVRDLNKIAARYKFERPKKGVFEDKAPMGLYALFDGQSCASTPGPLAAEFCARNFHTKLLEGISQLPPDQANEAFVQAVLIKSFEDLDRELLTTQPEVLDGCGAVVALLIGDRIFVASLGRCTAVLAEAGEGGVLKPTVLCKGKGELSNPEERRRLQQAGAIVVDEGESSMVKAPSGATSLVSRSLGDRAWKGAAGGGSGAPVVTCTPEVQCVFLKGAETHPFLLLYTSSVGAALSIPELLAKSQEYEMQPRAACGDIATAALAHYGDLSNAPQCTIVEVSFLPPKPKEQAGEKRKAPAAPESQQPNKKAKDSLGGGFTKSVRLRHILVKFVDSAKPAKPSDEKKKVTRTRQEAETLLRRAITELRKDQKSWTRKPKDANDLVLMSSKKFTELAREMSECDSAQRGGSMCGDLGWVTPEGRAKFGQGFKDVVDVLQPGQWSDIAVSEQGLHLVQRVA